jgi:hypothetical protein
MTDNHPPDLDEVRAALIQLNADPTEHKLRSAVKMLTGFTDAQLDDLGGFGTTH